MRRGGHVPAHGGAAGRPAEPELVTIGFEAGRPIALDGRNSIR